MTDTIGLGVRDTFTVHRRATIAAAACVAAYAVLLVATWASSGEIGAVLLLLVAGAGCAVIAWRERSAALIFTVALLVRAFAALAFHHAAISAGDPFRGSPDAWNYHVWGVRLAQAFQHGWFPSITSYYETGRWDVGYHYVLGFFYLAFGKSLLVGRLVGALFGALAALMLLLVARRVAPPRAALAAAAIYAVWPMSVGWSSDTILRDAFVWFLLLTATWLAIRFLDRPRVTEWCALFGVIAALRYTRAYPAYFFYAGLAVVLALSLLNRASWPRIASRAVPIVVLLVAVELFFISLGFPNAVQSVRGYDLPHWIEKPIPKKVVELPRITPVAVSPAGPADASMPLPPRPDAQMLAVEAPVSGHTSLAANAVRLLLQPFGWTFYLPGHSIWPVYSVWPWYFLLPAAGIGTLVLLRRGSILSRAIVIVTGTYLAVLGLVGKGDAIRQRESAVPFLILIAVAGVLALHHRRRILVPAYAAWVLLLTVGMAYHIHTLRGRRFSPQGVELPPVSASQTPSRAPAGSP